MRKPFVPGLVTQKTYLKQFEDGKIDLDIHGMREAAKKKKRNKLFTLVTAGLLLSSVALADYYLSDGTKVSWAGGNNVILKPQNGPAQIVSATRNADGRLVPTTGLTSSQRNQTNLLGSQSVGGNSQFNQNTGVSVPVFTNGQLTGFSNIFQNSSGLGRTFYTQNNGAGSAGQTVISGANGGSADFNWNRVDLTNGSTNGTSGQSTRSTGGTSGSAYVPPVNSYSPPRYAIDSFEIYHNTAWEQARIRNNRQMNQFYAGEALEVRVTGSNIRSAQVTFLFGNPNQDMPQMLIDSSDRRPTFQQTITLNGSLNGEGWLKHWAMIPDGNYTVRLSVTYNNGTTVTQEKQVQILGSVMDNMTPGGSDY